MPPVVTDRAVRGVVQRVFGAFADDIRRQRLDAGLTIRQLALAAGVDPSHLARIEADVTLPSPQTMARLSLALGSDLAARLYPNTGPLVRDRHQAAIAEAMVAIVHASWSRFAELGVRRPSRGWIDLAFHHEEQRTFVASEIQSELRRLEQLLRWSDEKAASLPSWDGWPRLGAPPAISKLLVVRATRATRGVAEEYRRVLRTAYPADPDDALASLTRGDAWPGPALLWATRRRGAATYQIVARP